MLTSYQNCNASYIIYKHTTLEFCSVAFRGSEIVFMAFPATPIALLAMFKTSVLVAFVPILERIISQVLMAFVYKLIGYFCILYLFHKMTSYITYFILQT